MQRSRTGYSVRRTVMRPATPQPARVCSAPRMRSMVPQNMACTGSLSSAFSIGTTKSMNCMFFSSQRWMLPVNSSMRSRTSAPLVSVSKVITVLPRYSRMDPTSSRAVPTGNRSRWKSSPSRERVTAPLELIKYRSKPSCWAIGRAKVCRRPVTRMISTPAACARRRACRLAGGIWNWLFSRVPSISMASRRMGGFTAQILAEQARPTLPLGVLSLAGGRGLRRGRPARHERKQHRHTFAVIQIGLAVNSNQILFFKKDAHEDVASSCHREEQVPQSHYRYRPEGDNKSQVNGVAHHTVKGRSPEWRQMPLLPAEIAPHLLQPEQFKMVDQEGADQQGCPSHPEEHVQRQLAPRVVHRPHHARDGTPLPQQQGQHGAGR